jgi:heme/copper-type cytochrome/quinol oxidase subunit 3
MSETIAHRRAAAGIPTSRLAMWWFLASEVAIFGGLIATYLLYRGHHTEWSKEAAHTISAAGAFNTMVLLSSSLTIVLAHKATSEEDHAKAFKLILATVGLGLVFLAVKTFEYSHEIAAGYTPARSLFWSFYYLMTGLHAGHVIAGMIALTVVGSAARRGEYVHRVEYVGMYWHLVDIVWIFLFPLLYLTS